MEGGQGLLLQLKCGVTTNPKGLPPGDSWSGSVVAAWDATLRKTLAPEGRAKLQQEQREWLNERDLFAVIHANQSWSKFSEASGTEGRAIAREKRVAELRARIGASDAR